MEPGKNGRGIHQLINSNCYIQAQGQIPRIIKSCEKKCVGNPKPQTFLLCLSEDFLASAPAMSNCSF